MRDCKTLVRRNAHEEPKLVSYIVPELTEWKRWLEAHNQEDIEDEGIEMGPTIVYLKRFRALQAVIRDHLKDRLASHSVPSVFIILQKLPINPNGKVDSPNLPFPDTAQMMEEASEEDLKSWESLSETEKAVATLWSTLIPGLNAKTLRYVLDGCSQRTANRQKADSYLGQNRISSTAVDTAYSHSKCC